MADVEVIQDNTAQWSEAMRAAVARGLERVGLMAEGYAKARCPVDTGRLRSSITHMQLDAQTEAIGTNVEYGKFVEYGTSRAAARPSLTPAATEHVAEYRAVMGAAMGA